MDTWPRGHDGRNHCHITEYRKKDGGKKKKKTFQENYGTTLNTPTLTL